MQDYILEVILNMNEYDIFEKDGKGKRCLVYFFWGGYVSMAISLSLSLSLSICNVYINLFLFSGVFFFGVGFCESRC